MAAVSSQNFSYLGYFDARVVAAASRAEHVLGLDPVGAIGHLRLFGELLAKQAAARLGVTIDDEESQVARLRGLSRQGLSRQVIEMFHALRVAGNRAVHDGIGDQSSAFDHLKIAWQLAIWFQRSFGNNKKFDPGPFVPPHDVRGESQRLQKEIAELRTLAEAAEQQRRAALEEVAEQTARLSDAEKVARQAQEERELWEALAEEEAAKRENDQEALKAVETRLRELEQQHQLELRDIKEHAAQATPAEAAEVVAQAEEAASKITLDEAATRRLIDEQLRASGWEANTESLRHAAGARPQKGKDLAIAEWPTQAGPADYVLFRGTRALAVVEAKKQRLDVSAALEQAKRYSRAFQPGNEAELSGGPWGEYRIPFLFATNGRPYLKQFETKSGIWFLDGRRRQNLGAPLLGWYTPEGLDKLLGQDIDAANEKLEQEAPDYLDLRDYQIRAIRAVEAAIASDERSCLVAMATGTGKTRTAIGLVYRLIKSQRFRRILFLVDRTALGEQAQNAFKEVQLENLQTFAEIFDLKGLEDTEAESATKLHIATVQGMVRRVLDAAEPGDGPAVDTYDCIVVDECHRGYGLDQEMSEGELKLAEYGIRSQADYISKYRRVLEYFDATKIGLTATPALHTKEIFGSPTFQYTYREAVIDGYLVDHEPPVSLVTKLAEEGIHWDKGAQVPLFDPHTQGLDFVDLEDEVNVEIESFNKTVVTENFNRVVCRELARHIDPATEGKTLVFCATDSHADLVVRLLKQAFQAQHGQVEDDAVVKITGSADKPLKLIRRFKNERNPNVVVTVDLLTTGIDVPAISNLVFLRRVKSRILYEQMLGRATRLCPDIEKESFRIFDAVALYDVLEPVTQMKPVVVRPNITFSELVQEIEQVDDEQARQAALDELVAKLQRKKQKLKGQDLDRFRAVAKTSPGELAKELGHGTPEQAAKWFRDHSFILGILEGAGSSRPLLVSDHQDELRRVERGYGKAQKPDDYLAEFTKFVRENLNSLPALFVVAQRPKELTREQLRELALKLDNAGFTEQNLQVAWREKTNQDIAATILGFIRQAALGDPLVPYEQRVDRALQKLQSKHSFTNPQRKWLERIGKQLKQEKIVDRAALDEGQFAVSGGFARLNKTFDGRLEEILSELGEAIWEVSA